VPEDATALPRVVLSIETDPRKVPTHRRLLEVRSRRDAMPPGSGRADPEAVAGDGGALPDGAPARSRDALPIWLRVVLVVLSLVLVAGALMHLQPRPQAPTVASVPAPQRAEPWTARPPPPAEPGAAPPPLPVVASEAPRAPEAEPSAIPPARPAPRAVPSAAPDDDTGDDTPARPPRPVIKRPSPAPPPSPPPPAPKPTFAPPFQLPSEKN
jgi:hypothetical protein